MNISKREQRFSTKIYSLMYNMSESQNNNHSVNEGQLEYYRGIIVSVVTLIMAYFDKEFDFSLRYMARNCPMDSGRIIYMSLPESWREDWTRITGGI